MKKWQRIKYNIITDAKHLFDETASSTYQKRPGDFSLGYIGALVNGTIGAETVAVIYIEFLFYFFVILEKLIELFMIHY